MRDSEPAGLLRVLHEGQGGSGDPQQTATGTSTMTSLRGAIIPVTPFQQNCAILWDDETKCALVVDPGGDVDRILAAIDQTGDTVERILLTHGHLDHAGGAAGLAEALRARPEAGPEGRTVPIEGPDVRDAFL